MIMLDAEPLQQKNSTSNAVEDSNSTADVFDSDNVPSSLTWEERGNEQKEDPFGLFFKRKIPWLNLKKSKRLRKTRLDKTKVNEKDLRKPRKHFNRKKDFKKRQD